MVTPHNASALLDRTLVDAAGDKIGTVTEVYLDDQTGEPSWLTVRTGWFGTNESFVPLDQVNTVEPVLRTSYDKAIIKGAPRCDAGRPLSRPEEEALYSYYGLSGPVNVDPSSSDEQGTGDMAAGHPGSARAADSDRPRLRKHVVTERQTVTVPVSHQVAKIERIPITETVEPGNFGEQEYAVVLHAERPVITTEVVAVERVRITDNPGTRSNQPPGGP